MIRKYLFSWFGLLFLAIVNGALRDGIYKPIVGDLASHQISVLTGIALFGLFIWFIGLRWPLSTSYQAWTIGLMWLAMTVAFEFLFFHYVRGVAWEILLHDYNIADGRLWILVLVWVTIAPWVMWKWRGTKLSS
jgi:hypothetical protein